MTKNGIHVVDRIQEMVDYSTLPDPTTDQQPATKKYVDDNGAGVSKSYVDSADALLLVKTNNLSDLTSIATARGNLGLGSISIQATNNVSITGGAISGITLSATINKVRYAVGSLSYSTTPTPLADNYNIVDLGTLTGPAAFVTPSGTPVDGDWLLIRGQQDSSGGHAVTFDSGYVFTTTVTNTITTTASTYFEILFRYHSGRSKWVAQAINNG